MGLVNGRLILKNPRLPELRPVEVEALLGEGDRTLDGDESFVEVSGESHSTVADSLATMETTKQSPWNTPTCLVRARLRMGSLSNTV